MSKAEILKLAKLWHKLADGFDAPPDNGVPNEHPIEPPSRRIVVAMGMVGSQYMDDSGLDIAEYQLFFELANRSGFAKIADLNRLLPYDASKLSRSATKFVKTGFLKSIVDKTDKRCHPSVHY